MKLDILLWRYRRKYRPDQPRDEIGRWTSGAGGGGRNDARVISDATPDNVKPGARYAEARRPSGYAVDLREEEVRGGHAISEHVGKSPQSLIRALRERNLSTIARGDQANGPTVGSFSTLEAANKLVNSTLSQNSEVVEQVATGRVPVANLTGTFTSATGYEAYSRNERSEPYLRDTYGVGAVIRHDPGSAGGYRIITAFPKTQ
jgi:hypothetical protein